MRAKWLKILLVSTLLAWDAGATAEGTALDAMESISGTTHYELVAENIDRPFQVLVLEPTEGEADTYPTIYLLDGGITFPLLAGYTQYLGYQGEVPPVIIVGISYGAVSFEDGNRRSTDYTAPSDERDYWGGAEAFQVFLQEQLIPFVEDNHPADPSKRVLFGQSLGGQFVLFSAQTSPDLFWGRIASNPALHRNLDWFLREPANGSGNSRLFVASAEQDYPVYREPAMAWIRQFDEAAGLPWILRTESIDGYGHFSLVTESYRRGLKWILTPEAD